MALAALEERPLCKKERRWRFAPLPKAGYAQHSNLLERCLANRGCLDPNTADQFLNPRLKSLADPFLLPDMGKAVERILRARASAELMLVFGDYDVDGITSCALLHETLTALECKVVCQIPHRMEDGYGLTESAVLRALELHKPALLIAVDCGSSSAETIQLIQQRGVDVIVLDHHQLGSPQPKPIAFVNPKAAVEPRFEELCSVGLAFKLAHALAKRGREAGLPCASALDIRTSLDLVALGTIADQVPLAAENRILAHAGLRALSQSTRVGLKALREVSQCGPEIGVYQVGFQLAPRLNAAGRLETAEEALQLLLTNDPAKAAQLARSLDEQNSRRKAVEQEIVEAAIERVRATFDPAHHYAIVQGDTEWHIGVVGIVASRVLREFYRPTIILGGAGEEWRGSGRSIEGFDLAAGLKSCSDLLSRHGGHAMAAGLSMNPARLEEFRQRFNDAARTALKPESLLPILELDAQVRLSELTLATVLSLEQLEPCGQGNPTVRLAASGLRLAGDIRRMGAEQQHARFRVSDGTATLDVVWWSCVGDPMPSGRFDLAFEPQVHEYQGMRSVQLKLLDWRPSRAAA
ncbi:MAG TPA: single-stranded-DNA-specific exonuclease RecJ [Methylomirabilota bacterium]|nr:single-stranded-DNA-specific exonuclease RecJ [Methylomirabilota bacterium]